MNTILEVIGWMCGVICFAIVAILLIIFAYRGFEFAVAPMFVPGFLFLTVNSVAFVAGYGAPIQVHIPAAQDSQPGLVVDPVDNSIEPEEYPTSDGYSMDATGTHNVLVFGADIEHCLSWTPR